MKIKGVDYKKIGDVYVPSDLVRESSPIRTAKDCLPHFAPFKTKSQEHLICLTLDGNHQPIKTHVTTIGLANKSQVHPREVFRPAIADGAVAVIVAHNHPSGNLEASEADLDATRRLDKAAKIIGIQFLDHMIVAVTGMVSLREKYPHIFENC